MKIKNKKDKLIRKINHFIGTLILFLINYSVIFGQAPSGKVEYVYNSKLAFDPATSILMLEFYGNVGVTTNISWPKNSEYSEMGNETIVIDGDKYGLPMYINAKTKKVQAKAQGIYSDCIVEDVLSPIQWKIFDEYKTISKYRAQKAKGVMGGRMYEVWFTSDIPISAGPYKLIGLPGLVLEAISADEKIKILFKSYDNSYNKPLQPLNDFIKLPVYEYKEYLKRKARKIQNKLLEFEGFEPLDNKKVDWQIEKGYF